ncbi:N-acetylglucosamine-6-phosphate deacetylase [Deinococcus cellulosilyticus]|uniref:N-acetylglucosamine-6-phosphate deacetylase n=1 Tax=Deinococcus cellulosilyticus (strain DSM 18568 / NBRC 106333 / KACC 11606 / 5516J-15) TaxID=1223518 RepID=A0A511N4F0_DEIC1|nr:N-acetylglucosamine-6-phosphate deacetylase [Deinococcus cellulosilyticus]GEM47306.1 N-acetylglucosamine-6-phosphate deacetylase [Deinococcus cellulosilyticus NBRC 106333 = KACC 11606]
MKHSLTGQVLTAQGLKTGTLHFDQQVLGFEEQELQGPQNLILPGFIDVHVHGGGGFDVMDGLEGIRGMARYHARHGTTSLLATTMTGPWDQVVEVLRDIKQASQTQEPDCAQVLGAHLEGPFISKHRLGAQPDFTLEPTPERVSEALSAGNIRVVTLAPEVPHAAGGIRQFVDAGVRVSIGHTAGNEQDALQAVELGASSCTHTFNATGGLTGREPGVLGVVLTSEMVHAEVILDFHHVHPLSFKLLTLLKPDRTLLITDAMRAAGLQDGIYDLGGQEVTVQGGVTRTLSGSLAGSVLTMDQAFRNAVQCGLSVEEASRLASLNPAKYLGLEKKGMLEQGWDADLVVLGPDLEVHQVFVGGTQVKQEIQPV